MRIRKAIFWTHLAAGVTAAIVIVMMSVTGVILTYDRQIKEWADRELYDIDESLTGRLTVDELLDAVRKQDPDLNVSAIAMFSRPDSPPIAAQGRRGLTYLDPFTGKMLGEGNTEVRGFFSTITGWHRWFDLTGDARATGRTFTGAANLLFVFLIVSGIYLWLPPIWRWIVIRQRMFFNDRVKTSKARDYNWHHVFGFWSLIPIFLVAVSALPLSYTWARNSVYVLAGEEIPARAGPQEAVPERIVLPDGARLLPLHRHFEFAVTQSDGWRRIDIQPPKPDAGTVNLIIDEGSGGEPTKKTTLILDRVTGSIVGTESFADRTAAGKVLSYFRWVHTGEAHGLIGQTVAGIVSGLAVLMAWTGIALSYRRLIQPSIRRRRLAKQQHRELVTDP